MNGALVSWKHLALRAAPLAIALAGALGCSQAVVVGSLADGETSSTTGRSSSAPVSPTSGSGGGQGGSGQGGSGGAAAYPPIDLGEGFNLVDASWINLKGWQLELLDPATGYDAPVATLDNLGNWTGRMVLDREATHVYLTTYQQQDHTLWVVDLATGTWTTTALDRDCWVAGVTDDGRVVTTSWTDSVELAVALVDPATGKTTPLGIVDGLMEWWGQSAYDYDRRILYTFAADHANVKRLFAFSLDTQLTTSVTVDVDGYVDVDVGLGGVEPGGGILAAHGRSTGWPNGVLDAVWIDPASGAVTVLGQFGDLRGGVPTYDRTRNLLLAVGVTSPNTTGTPWTYDKRSIVTFDLSSGQSTQVALQNDRIWGSIIARP